jgi:CHAD domain-containing protein
MLVRQRLGALRRALPLARQGDAGAVHQARVATRRLRETIPLVARGATRRKLERTVRSLTRALGPVRELDVAAQMLRELAASPDIPPTAVACLHQAIEDERGRLHGDLVRMVEKTNLVKLARKAVAAAREAAERAVARSRDPRHVAAARQRAARRAEALRAAIDNAAAIYLPDRLHDVRIALKKLRYSMEIARELSRSRATARILALKRAQDLLGRMHDLEVLIARTRAVQGSTRALNLRLSADLDRLVRALEAECRLLHARYIASRTSLLAICDYAVGLPAAAGRKASAA